MFPAGGMTDGGVVVEIMWLDSSEYERADQRPTLNELQWIQYQLDSHATGAEVIAAAPGVRVSPVHARVHSLACDKTSACAAFEWVDGKRVVTSGARALTNPNHAGASPWAAMQK